MPEPLRVFDGHNDTLTKHFDLDPSGASFLSGSEKCCLDIPKALQGSFAGGLFAVFTDPPEGDPERDMAWGVTFTGNGYTSRLRGPLDPSFCAAYTDRVIEYLFLLEKESRCALKVVRSREDLGAGWSEGSLKTVLHIEGAEAIRADLSNLTSYYEKGVRSIGPTWSRPNAFGTGVAFGCPSSPDQGPGLTEAGKELVRACNRMGLVVDLAHLNYKGFMDVAALTSTPLVVSHSNAHALCPSARNLLDGQVDAVAASGGVIGINFEPSMLRKDGKPGAPATLGMLADHIDYLVKRAGISHVGLGSDFDGAGVPEGMEDASKLPNLWPVLQERGYGREELENLAHGNWLRVLRATLRD